MGPMNATSPYLKAEVDRKSHWDDFEVRKFAAAAESETVVAPTPSPNLAPHSSTTMAQLVQPEATPPNQQGLAVVAQHVFAMLPHDLQTQVPKTGALPQEVDRRLLAEGRKKLGRTLDEQERHILRDALRAAIPHTG